MTATTEPSYAATEQHIHLLVSKQARLAEAQLAAENQLIHAVARERLCGNVSYYELRDLYYRLHGIRCPGFMQRWTAQLPHITVINNEIKEIEAGGRDPHAQSWAGSYPFQLGEPRPDSGICVVYVLFNEENLPCYVGSTSSFRERMWGHRTDGKQWVRWQAHRCKDREHAYQVEEQFLQRYKPYLNKKATR